MKASQPHLLHPALEVIRGRWTRPETPLQPLPAPGGPCTLSVHPAAAPFKKVPRSGWEPRSASSSAAELNSQAAGQGASGVHSTFWEKRLWDPTFFFFFFCPQRGFFVLRTRGSNFCGDKRGKFCASCVTLASVLENNLRVPLCSSCVPLLLQLLWKKFTIVDSLVVSSAPQLIHSSSLPAEQKGVGI